jgi:hypothetical protein
MIEQQIVESIISVRHLLKFHSHTFELIGYDFMMIQNKGIEVRLIEANTNPCLEEPN